MSPDISNEKRLLILFIGKSRLSLWCDAVWFQKNQITFYGANNIWMPAFVSAYWDKNEFVIWKCASCLNMRDLLSHPVLLMKKLHVQQHK